MILANDRWELEASDRGKPLAPAEVSYRLESIERIFYEQASEHLRSRVSALRRYCTELQEKVIRLELMVYCLAVGLAGASIPWILYLMGEIP